MLCIDDGGSGGRWSHRDRLRGDMLVAMVVVYEVKAGMVFTWDEIRWWCMRWQLIGGGWIIVVDAGVYGGGTVSFLVMALV